MRAGAVVRVEAPVVNGIRCARCGHSFERRAWGALRLERRLTRTDLGAYVSGWPPDSVVEVRCCAQCGGSIARRASLE
jgi:hypothetical protein